MEVPGWLIRKDDLRSRNDRPRYGDKLLLATGQQIRVEIPLGDNLKAVQDVRNKRLSLAPRFSATVRLSRR
jgi:hypothetical protein